MLEYFSKNNTVTLGAAGAESVVPFSNRHLQKGTTAEMSGNTVDLNCCGLYDVSIGLSVSSATAADLTFVLYVDNVAQPQTQRTISAATIDDYYTVDISTYVQKQGNNTACPCTSATNVYLAVSASVADAVLTFETTDIQVYKVR